MKLVGFAYYNILKFTKNIPKVYNREGIKAINPNNIGNKTVQQKDINWSKRILGKDALTHMNTKTINELFTPKLKLVNNPFIDGLFKDSSLNTL